MPKIAVIQHPPVLGNRDATLARAIKLAKEAASAGAQLLVFPEAYVPGYPTWVWRLNPGADMALAGELHDVLVNNSINLSAGQLEPLCASAKELNVDILCGINELNGEGSAGTIFNSYVHVSHTGKIINVHRKLMPTNPERMTWGFGDGRGLVVHDTPVGRVGSLICWENFMPLPRMALYAQGIDIFCAPTWDSSDGWAGTMQHIAREGRCYVVNCCTSMQGRDVPQDLPGRSHCFPDDNEWINTGKSSVIAPGGSVIAGPVEKENTILYADIDLQKVRSARRTLDVGGHYSRPDVFTFEVDRQKQKIARTKD